VDRAVISNNYFSADLVAFTPGAAIHRIPPAESDNLLPRLLHDHAGLESLPLPRTSATQFNIDSPSDLVLLRIAGGAGSRLTAFLESMTADLATYDSVMRCIVDPKAELIVAGRVGSSVWQYAEKETACRVRVFSEERGMGAAGRTDAARSLLGFHLREVGAFRFFQHLAELGDAACIDARPMLGHLGIGASRADRFLTDLGCAQQIDNGFLREFAQAANEAPLPVLLGGHSLVAGGLMLLTEAAWRREDERIGARGD
jgi:hypothetical protein